MRRIRSWQAAVGCLVFAGLLAGLAAFWVRSHSEPVYAGRTLSEWLADLDFYGRPQTLLASNAIQHIGTAALPHVGPMLRAEDSPTKLRLLRLLSKIGIKSNVVPANRLRERAARACRVLGPAAAQYLPELTAMLDTWDGTTALFAYEAILNVKPKTECVPELIIALTNNYAQVRWEAALVLGDLKTEDSAALQALTAALKDPEAEVRKHVLRAFFLTNPRSQQSSNAALAQLDDANADVRQQAIQFLVRVRPNSRQAKDRIIACSTDSDMGVRSFVLGNYRGFGLEQADLLRMAENYVRDPDPGIRLTLTHQLAKLWRKSAEAKELLERCAEDSDERVRSTAEAYLKGQPTQPAPPQITVPKPSGEARVTAGFALQLAETAPSQTVWVFIKARVLEGHWIYALENSGSKNLPTRIEDSVPAVLEARGSWHGPAPKIETDGSRTLSGDELLFRRQYRIAPGARPQKHKLRFKLEFQVCNDMVCWPPEAIDMEAELEIVKPR